MITGQTENADSVRIKERIAALTATAALLQSILKHMRELGPPEGQGTVAPVKIEPQTSARRSTQVRRRR